MSPKHSPRLPLELIEQALSHLSGSGRLNALANMALVSRSINLFATTHLETVLFGNLRDFEQFLRHLGHLNVQHLASDHKDGPGFSFGTLGMVKHLEVILSPSDHFATGDSTLLGNLGSWLERGPLFGNLETLHITTLHYRHHHAQPPHYSDHRVALHLLVQGILSMCSAKHVRYIQFMTDSPTLGLEANTEGLHSLSRINNELDLPNKLAIEGILGGYPLETYELPWIARTLCLGAMRMTSELVPTRGSPIPFQYRMKEAPYHHAERLIELVQGSESNGTSSRSIKGPQWCFSGTDNGQRGWIRGWVDDMVVGAMLPNGVAKEEVQKALLDTIVFVDRPPFELDSATSWRRRTLAPSMMSPLMGAEG